jgi:hypothetical protein
LGEVTFGGSLTVDGNGSKTPLTIKNDISTSTSVIVNISDAATNVSCTITEAGDLGCSGTKSAIVGLEGYGERKLFAVESSSVRHVDEGRAILRNGFANITLDPIFVETIEGDYNVYLTPEKNAPRSERGAFFSLYVAEKSKDYFVVKSNRKNNAIFSWMVSAYRSGYSEGKNSLGSEPSEFFNYTETDGNSDIEKNATPEVAFFSNSISEENGSVIVRLR